MLNQDKSAAKNYSATQNNQNQPEITILIPAYNEAERIGEVLNVVTAFPAERIVVIDDGSSDGTSEKAAHYPVDVLTHKENRGKGAALQTGIDYIQQSPYWIFLDADLINLTVDHIHALVAPITNDDQAQMTVGMFTAGGKLHVDLAQRFFGILNGQRAFSQAFISQLPLLTQARFGVEIFLSRYARCLDAKVAFPVMEGVTQWTKEEKFGFFSGFTYRLVMYRECLYMLFFWRRFLTRALAGLEK